MQINAVPLIQNADGALHYLFTENFLVRKIAEMIFLSLREIIIKSDVTLIHLASRNLSDVLRMHKVQGQGEMRDPLYMSDLFALSCALSLRTSKEERRNLKLTGCVLTSCSWTI